MVFLLPQSCVLRLKFGKLSFCLLLILLEWIVIPTLESQLSSLIRAKPVFSWKRVHVDGCRLMLLQSIGKVLSERSFTVRPSSIGSSYFVCCGGAEIACNDFFPRCCNFSSPCSCTLFNLLRCCHPVRDVFCLCTPPFLVTKSSEIAVLEILWEKRDDWYDTAVFLNGFICKEMNQPWANELF